GEIREAAGAFELGRYRPHPGACLLNQAALIVRKPEGFLVERRAAGGETELIRQVLTFLDAGPFGEEIVGVQRVVAIELPHRAAQLAGSGLERRIEHRAARAAVLGAERAGQDLDLVDG